ncbi:MAG: hypothetical protein PHV99_00275 [Candidatus Pacebacteria bacterium]|nr:hypothetical protein [Candidatus Paceibacterota bacterium]
MNINKHSLLGVVMIIPIALIVALHPIPAKASLLFPGFSFPCPAEIGCTKEQTQARVQLQKQAAYDAGCQSYIDSHGGHGTSVSASDGSECKTTCSTGYHLNAVNACAPNTTVAPATSNQSVSQSGKYASGLTTQQINAIVVLLQAFGASQTVIVQVEAALRGK